MCRRPRFLSAFLGALVVAWTPGIAPAGSDCMRCGDNIDLQALFPGLAAVLERGVDTPALFLSGGAAYGAWGAGVVFGRQLKNQRTREFQLVTGVSTGGLMASLVFLGKREDLDELKRVYTDLNESDIQKCSLFRVIFGRGYCSREPLRDEAKKVIEPRLARIQNAQGALLLGTVRLEKGEFCAWNMQCVAKQDGLDGYLDVVMATANALGIGTPVEIDGKLHVDGGGLHQLFARQLVRDVCPKSAVCPIDAYFLINGKLEGFAKVDVERSTLKIAERGLELLEGGAMLPTVHYFKEYTRRNVVSVSHIPEAYTVEFRKRDFKEENMEGLFEAGCAWGYEHDRWRQWRRGEIEPDPPALDVPNALPTGCEAIEEH